jgi:hypothetical protein
VGSTSKIEGGRREGPADYDDRGENMSQKNVMSAEDNKAILLRFFSELRTGKTSAIDEVCSPNFAFHSPNFPNWPRGLEGARAIATLGQLFFRIANRPSMMFSRLKTKWSCDGQFAVNTSEDQSRDSRTPASVLRWALSQFIASSMER